MNRQGWMIPGLLALALAPSGGLAQEKETTNDPRFRDLLLGVAKSYPAFGKVDDVLRFAPALCASPAPVPIRLSGSPDAGTHGRKLYFLYAWDAALYLKRSQKDYLKSPDKAPVFEGKPAIQTLVKQSWTSVKVEKEGLRTADVGGPPREVRVLTKDGVLFKAGEAADLFIMVKLGDPVEGTDEGWVYGTVTADQKKVTSAGRVKSCMACHETAGPGRLFGLPGSKTDETPARKN